MRLLHIHTLTGHKTFWHWMVLIVLLLLLLLTFPQRAHSADGIWEVFTIANSPLINNWVEAIAIDASGRVWIGTVTGLNCYDDGDWTAYTTDNSDLPGSWISDVTVDSDNRVWAATNGGIVMISGDDWTIYTKENTDSGLKNNMTSVVTFDDAGTVWIGTEGSAVVTYDGSMWDWFHYDRVPELTGYWINDIHCGPDGTIWVAMQSGAASFNGTSWEHHDIPVPNMGPTSVSVRSIISDRFGTTCAITGYGLWKYGVSGWYEYQIMVGDDLLEGMHTALFDTHYSAIATVAGLAVEREGGWELYTTSNSLLPDDAVLALAMEPDGRLWVGTLGGVAVVDGLTLLQVAGDKTSAPAPIVLDGCYPNPFNNNTAIVFTVYEPTPLTLSVYSVTGQLVRHFDQGTALPGNSVIVWDGTDDSGNIVAAGVYLYRLYFGKGTAEGRMIFLK